MKFEAEHLKQASSRSELIELARKLDIPIDKTLRKLKYEAELEQLQIEMVNLQKWVARTGRG